MPHERPRHLERLLKKSLGFSPIVGILGHRQVGKTTLAQKIGTTYLTLDLKSTSDLAEADPVGFLNNRSGSPLVIDECQLVPELFPALKEQVRVNKRPGQFLITGSVRFTSRKAIKESLTGRIINWELLPMDLAETQGKRLSEIIPKILLARSVEIQIPSTSKSINEHLEQYLLRGGLPGVFPIRDPAIRSQRFETQLETLLDRDLRLISETTLDFGALRRILQYLAQNQGSPLDLAKTSRAVRISPITLKKIISAFESIFLIRTILSEGSERKSAIFFEDQGEATHLQQGSGMKQQDFDRFLFANIKTQLAYRPELKLSLTQLRNRGGAFIPFIIRSVGTTLGILPILEENPGKQALSSAASFLQKNPTAKVIFVTNHKRDLVLAKNQRIIPASIFLGID